MDDKHSFLVKQKITNRLVILMICYVGFRALSYLIIPLKTAYLSENTNDFYIEHFVITTVELISFYGFNIVTGLVLIGLSKNNPSQKALWFFMGVVFGFSALLIFFVLEIRNHILDK